MDTDTNQSGVAMLRTLESHAYMKMAELIDGNHLDEARKVADILQTVGVV